MADMLRFLVTFSHREHGDCHDTLNRRVIPSDGWGHILDAAREVYPTAEPKIEVDGYMVDEKTRTRLYDYPEHLCSYTVQPVLVIGERMFKLEELKEL